MSNKTTREQTENLTRKLENLVIKQDAINSRVAETRTRIKALRELSQRDTWEQKGDRTKAILGSGYFIGDLVDIRNPSLGQELRGTIVGTTKDYSLRIQTEAGNTLRRVPKNVRLSLTTIQTRQRIGLWEETREVVMKMPTRPQIQEQVTVEYHVNKVIADRSQKNG